MNQERETVVVTEGGGGPGIIIGIIAVVLIALGVIYFVNVNSGGQGGSINIEVPAVSVTEGQ